MDTFDDFAAAIPKPYQVLGLNLRPLSLGRYRLLHRFKCAFVSETETTASISDLLLGVSLCSMRCDDFINAYESGEYFKFLKRWSKHISANPPWYLRGKWGRVISSTFIGKWWRKNHSFNFIEKLKLFQGYILDAQKMPNYVPVNDNGRSSTAHWSTSVEIVLRSDLGWTLEEINESPLTKALSDYFKHLEHQGLVIIFSEKDAEEGKRNAEALEQMAKLLGGSNGP